MSFHLQESSGSTSAVDPKLINCSLPFESLSCPHDGFDSINGHGSFTVNLGYTAHPKLDRTPPMWSFNPDDVPHIVCSSAIIWFNGGDAIDALYPDMVPMKCTG